MNFLPRAKIRDLQIVTPNFSGRLSGVTSTLERVLAALGTDARIAALGVGLAPNARRMKFRHLPLLWRQPCDAARRIWHARRNIEMLAGVVLRDLLGFPLLIVFTSASQRHHTRWTRFLIDRMDALIATSPASATYLRHPARIISHGISADVFYPADRAATRAALGLPALKLIGCFGRIRPGKGSDIFVDAMIEVLKARPEAGAILLGRATGKYSSFLGTLYHKIRAAGLGERFLIMPEVGTGEIADWYRALDIFVAPQRWEGFGVTPLEAMATELPVVATRVGAFPTIVTNRTGVLVPPANVPMIVESVTHLLDNPKAAGAMGKAGRERVISNFSIQAEAAQLLDVYKTLIRCVEPNSEAKESVLPGLQYGDTSPSQGDTGLTHFDQVGDAVHSRPSESTLLCLVPPP